MGTRHQRAKLCVRMCRECYIICMRTETKSSPTFLIENCDTILDSVTLRLARALQSQLRDFSFNCAVVAKKDYGLLLPFP